MRAAPHEGAANAALCRVLAKALGVPPARRDRRWGDVPHQAREDRGRCRGARAQRWRRSARARARGNRMTARIIDGKAIAAELRARVAAEVQRLRAEHSVEPGLAVVLVGENPASAVYVRNKAKQTVEAGMRSFDHRLPEHGLARATCWRWSQSSMPIRRCTASWCSFRCRSRSTARRCSTRSIPPRTSTAFTRSTPAGSRPDCRRSRPARRSAASCWRRPCIASLDGMEAVVVGRSNIVGKPLIQLLLARERHRDGRAFEDARPARRRAAAPTSCSRRSAGPKWCAATGSSRARP